MLFFFLRDCFRTRLVLQAEILALRHQLLVLERARRGRHSGAESRRVCAKVKPRESEFVIVEADPVVRQIVVHHIKRMDFFLLDGGSSVWDYVLIRRSAKMLAEDVDCVPSRVSKKNLALRKTALESTLPPHNDGAARRVSERIESGFHRRSEFLLHDLLACPSPVQDESGPHGNRAGRKTSVV